MKRAKMPLEYAVFMLLIMLLTACDKDDSSDYGYPTTLHVRDMEYSDVRLFTHEGEIFNKNVINMFIEGQKSFFLDRENIQGIDYFEETITFTSKDSMLFCGDGKYSVIEKDHVLLFYSDFYFLGKQTYGFSLSDVLKYSAPKFGLPYSSIDDYTQKEIMVAQGDYTHLQLLGLNCQYVLIGIDGYAMNSRMSVFNQFNESGISKLGKRDTLAIQEFKLFFEK